MIPTAFRFILFSTACSITCSIACHSAELKPYASCEAVSEQKLREAGLPDGLNQTPTSETEIEIKKSMGTPVFKVKTARGLIIETWDHAGYWYFKRSEPNGNSRTDTYEVKWTTNTAQCAFTETSIHRADLNSPIDLFASWARCNRKSDNRYKVDAPFEQSQFESLCADLNGQTPERAIANHK